MCFFHKIANLRACSNAVRTLKVDGSWVMMEENIDAHIEAFYKSLYAEQFGWRPCLKGIECGVCLWTGSVGSRGLSRKIKC